jgi:hypothetical protein
MSLVALALRLATVRALRGATLAADRVYDSKIDPIDHDAVNEANPIIIVATDDDDREVEGRDLLGARRKLDLVIELAVAAKTEVQTGEATQRSVVVLDADAGFEIVLNLMGRQVDRALLAGASPWSDLWRSVTAKVVKYESRRGAGVVKEGQRFAAHQLILQVDTIAEPSFGPVAPGSVWDRILTAMRTDASLMQIADLLQMEITTPTLADWRKAAADLGLRDVGAMSIGLGPAIENPPLTEPSEPLVEVTFADRDQGTTWVGNADTVNTATQPEE